MLPTLVTPNTNHDKPAATTTVSNNSDHGSMMKNVNREQISATTRTSTSVRQPPANNYQSIRTIQISINDIKIRSIHQNEPSTPVNRQQQQLHAATHGIGPAFCQVSASALDSARADCTSSGGGSQAMMPKGFSCKVVRF